MIIWLAKAVFLIVATLIVSVIVFYTCARLFGRFFGLIIAQDSVYKKLLQRF